MSPVAALSSEHVDLGQLSQTITGETSDSLVSEQLRQGFRVGDVYMMMTFDQGNQLTDIPALYPLPNTPEWFIGYCNLQGNLVPVFDLKTYLNIQHNSTAEQHTRHATSQKLLVLLQGDNAAGILIDGIPQRLTWQQVQKTSIDIAPTKLQSHILDGFVIDDTVWFDIDIPSLLNALEQDAQS